MYALKYMLQINNYKYSSHMYMCVYLCVCVCVCVCVCMDAEGNSTKERRKTYFSGIIFVSKSYYE